MNRWYFGRSIWHGTVLIQVRLHLLPRLACPCACLFFFGHSFPSTSCRPALSGMAKKTRPYTWGRIKQKENTKDGQTDVLHSFTHVAGTDVGHFAETNWECHFLPTTGAFEGTKQTATCPYVLGSLSWATTQQPRNVKRPKSVASSYSNRHLSPCRRRRWRTSTPPQAKQ